MFNKVAVYAKGNEPKVYGGVKFEPLGNGYLKGMALQKNLAYLKLVCKATLELPAEAQESKPKRIRRTKAQIEADAAAAAAASD